MKALTEQNKADIMAATLSQGQALYLIQGEIIIGTDGCQPSNAACIAVGPWSFRDSDESMEDIEAALEAALN